MTAEEMFKKLGMDKCVDDGSIIQYATRLGYSKTPQLWRVTFRLLFQAYEVWSDEQGSGPYYRTFVIPEVHQAIHQQMKELGWLDD